MREAGSSPLTRGKPVERLRDRRPRRLIPAHAGKTARQGRASRSPRAHPRSRGENIVVSAPIIIRQGSSPLTRGKRLTESLLPLVHRLIPAHAGKTVLGMDYISQPWAHPRSRGENVHSRVTPHAHAGSSPLTRGKPGVESKARDLLRLIPAHAGKTSCSRCVILAGRAHPRSRGENFSLPWCCSAPYGSSPLTRGKRARRSPGPGLAGLIPAHAGKTAA